MHEQHPATLLHWLLVLFGNALLWLGNHAATLLGCASVVFGMLMQWRTYQLAVKRAEREAAQQAGGKP